MKHVTFGLVAVATVAGLIAFVVPRQATRRESPPVRYRNSSRVPRLAVDLLGP